jgi:hypothetical protein
MPRFTCCIGTRSLPRNGAGDNSILNHEKHEADANLAAKRRKGHRKNTF